MAQSRTVKEQEANSRTQQTSSEATKSESHTRNTANAVSAALFIPVEERAKLEYEYAHERWTNGTNQRRSGLAFFTAVQGALLTIIGDRMTNLDASARALVIFGLFVTVIAWNHERRIGAHMEGYQRRAIEIEEANGMSVIRRGRDTAQKRWTLSNRTMFAVHFLVIAAAWLVMLGYDIVEHF